MIIGLVVIKASTSAQNIAYATGTPNVKLLALSDMQLSSRDGKMLDISTKHFKDHQKAHTDEHIVTKTDRKYGNVLKGQNESELSRSREQASVRFPGPHPSVSSFLIAVCY